MRERHKDTRGQILPVPVEVIERRIYLVRLQKVMLDADLARLYEVPTKVFNQAVKRNLERFPEDFMFQLTSSEAASLRSQFVTSNGGRGGSRYLPFVFTEHGVGHAFFNLEEQTRGTDEHPHCSRFCEAPGDVFNAQGLGREAGKA